VLQTAFKVYICSLAVLSTLLVNLPLFFTYRHAADTATFWGLVAHNPNQYLFHALFFPFVAIFICLGGLELDRFLETTRHSALRDYAKYRGIFYLGCFAIAYLVLVFVVFFTSRPGDVIDLAGLSPEYAQRGVAANRFVLESMVPALPDQAVQSDLGKLTEWQELKSTWPDSYRMPMKDLVPIVVNNTHHGMATRSGKDLRALLETDVAMLSNHLHVAIPYLQLVFDRRYLDRVQAAFPDLEIFDQRDLEANAVELGANALIIGHFFTFLIALILIKRRAFQTSPFPSAFMEVAKKLYVAVAMYAFWVGLRLLTLQDINLVFGGRYGTLGDVFAGAVLVATSAVYLTAVMTSAGKVMDRLANLWPIAAGTGAALASFSNPLLASQLFGSLADPRQLAIVIFAFFLVIILCIIWVMTRPVAART
jgi:hypothetical protein